LKNLYNRHGYLTRELMLEQNGALAGPSSYQSHFGSLMKAYKLVGYEPPSKRSLIVERNQATWTEQNLLAQRLSAMFPSHVLLSRRKQCERPLLKLDTGQIITILTCRSYKTPSGRTRWLVNRRQLHPDATLALIALYDVTNQSLSTFALCRTQDLPPTMCRFQKEGPVWSAAVKLPDLFTFYENAQRLSTNG
jgi:hypothetical protein